MNILVADFECPAQANAMAEVLYRGGHNPLPVYSQQEALDHAGWPARERFIFEIVFLCTVRPHIEGLDFADRLREKMSCSPFAVVLIGTPDDVEFLRSLRRDFSYLAQPFKVEDLLGMVRDLKLQIDEEIKTILDFCFGPGVE